jgi:hypothetical protein
VLGLHWAGDSPKDLAKLSSERMAVGTHSAYEHVHMRKSLFRLPTYNSAGPSKLRHKYQLATEQ